MTGTDAVFPLHLRGGGVSVVFHATGEALPAAVYWGAELPDDASVIADVARTASPAVQNSSLDAPRSVSIAPTQGEGWSGTPGIAWHTGAAAGHRLTLVSTASSSDSATFTLAEPGGALVATYAFSVSASGVVVAQATVENAPTPDATPGATRGATRGATPGRGSSRAAVVDLTALRLVLPVPSRARELLDFTGRWSGERREQRRAVADGTWLRATHRGRPGHDAPFLTAVGTDGFGFGRGEVWATHTGWSGSQEHLVERLPEGAGSLSALIGGGELLEPGELRLSPGDRFASPVVSFSYAADGLDAVSARFHRELRSGDAYPSGPRPLVLNTWEAVYFDHDFDTLVALAERAAAIGVERFVLDDGWFRGRRDDTAGLGDWFVDEAVWPGGLGRLSDRVHELGMQFGLWFEPEMVNLDSDLARAHPDWILGDPAGDALTWRHQHVLNLTRGDAWEYVRSRIDDVVTASGVDFIKWDHNRDLHAATDRASGASVVHGQTLAVYRLMDALRAAHPHLEIESCASGGARIDLGIMQHAQRVWASDTNDPVERQLIQRGTGMLLPPELIGAHVGPEEAHTTSRSTALSFRLATALFGHAGIEWNLNACSDDELRALHRWAGLYRELRPLLHAGVTVHGDDLEEGTLLSGVVAHDRGHAVFSWARIATGGSSSTARVRLPGLDADARYEVRIRDEAGAAHLRLVEPPSWLPASGRSATLSGRVLTGLGVPLPLLDPGNALILELQRVDGGDGSVIQEISSDTPRDFLNSGQKRGRGSRTPE